jgi:CheY-like chemotaxis protein
MRTKRERSSGALVGARAASRAGLDVWKLGYVSQPIAGANALALVIADTDADNVRRGDDFGSGGASPRGHEGCMRTVLGRVLVIDDDAFMLRVISDLLEKAGFQVLVQESPVGATQVIMRERVDAAIIDWNLPTLQGDDVVRLLRTWDEVKNLPLLLITGAPDDTLETIRTELPGVIVLSKTNIREQLVATLGSILGSGNTVRGLMPVQIGKSGEPRSAPQARPRSTDLVSQLLTELTGALPAVAALWSGVARGEREEIGSLTTKLERLAGQAQLLALHEAADLLNELSSTLRALPAQRKVPRDVRRAVEGGMAALSALPKTGDGAFTIPPEPLIGALRKAREELVHPS